MPTMNEPGADGSAAPVASEGSQSVLGDADRAQQVAEPPAPAAGGVPSASDSGAEGVLPAAGKPVFAAPVSTGTEAPPVQAIPVGERLTNARTALGLSVEAAAAHLKVSGRKIAALEDEQWASLPQGPYLRGFIRSYAKLLHIDAADLLESLDGRIGQDAPSVPLTLTPSLATPFPERSVATHDSRVSRLMFLVAPVIGLIAAFIWWSGTSSYDSVVARAVTWWPQSAAPGNATKSTPDAPVAQSTRAPARTGDASGASLPAPDEGTTRTVLATPVVEAPVSAPAPIPARDTPASAAPAPAPALRLARSEREPGDLAPAARDEVAAAGAALVMNFREDAWVEVRQANGRTVFSQLSHAGAEKAIDGAPPFDLVIGNAPGVTLTYRGTVLDLAPYTRDRVAHLTLK